MSEVIILEDRGVVEVAGADAAKFLHNLVTNDIGKLPAGAARYCALLTPQGKILVDFLVFALEEGESRRYLLDCPLALEGELVRRLGMYKLRAAVTISPRSEGLAAFAVLTDTRPETPAIALARDPRSEKLGWRGLAARGTLKSCALRADYEARRIAATVPQGGIDFAYGDTFPHEANMDLLAGVDFSKGCYVGQEVVSRTQHRGLARRRVVRYRAESEAPPPGAVVRAAGKELGLTGSHSQHQGLALIRLDRLAEARAAAAPPEAGGAKLEFDAEGLTGSPT
jgi:folate-binding protein YgfZ